VAGDEHSLCGAFTLVLAGVETPVARAFRTLTDFEFSAYSSPLWKQHRLMNSCPNVSRQRAEWEAIQLAEQRERVDRKRKKTKRPPSGLVPLRVVRIPRNLPCPCGSGRKYKHCCRTTSAIPEMAARQPGTPTPVRQTAVSPPVS